MTVMLYMSLLSATGHGVANHCTCHLPLPLIAWSMDPSRHSGHRLVTRAVCHSVPPAEVTQQLLTMVFIVIKDMYVVVRTIIKGMCCASNLIEHRRMLFEENRCQDLTTQSCSSNCMNIISCRFTGAGLCKWGKPLQTGACCVNLDAVCDAIHFNQYCTGSKC